MTSNTQITCGGKNPGRAGELPLDYRAIFNAAGNGMAFTDYDSGRIIDVNAAWIRSTGMDREQSAGKTALELGLWANQTERQACMNVLDRKGCVVDFEAGLMMQSGESPHLISGELVEMDGRRCVLWEFHNIAERKRINEELIKSEEKVRLLLAASEQSRRALLGILEDEKRTREALRESEAFRKRVFDTSRIPIVVMDVATSQYIDCNLAAVQIYRFSTREEVLGKVPLDFSAPVQYDGAPSAEKTRYYIEKAVAEGAAVFEWRHQRPDGELWDAEIHLMNFQSGQRQLLQFTVQDITEQKRREEELHQKNDEITRFLYTASHDLRSPLVTISAFLGYLEEDIKQGNTAGLTKDISFIKNAAHKMALLLDELLNLSRIGRKVTPPEEARLQTIAQAAVDLVAGRITQRGVAISITNQPVVLYGDQQRLIELYQNLIDNAIKFMGGQPQPQVEIGALQEDDAITLFVRDNGMGIEPRYHHKLFGIFEKLETGTDGVGMGLAIVKRIVEVHGGTIWVESAGAGQGATFCFTLARTRFEPEQTGRPPGMPGLPGRITTPVSTGNNSEGELV